MQVAAQGIDGLRFAGDCGPDAPRRTRSMRCQGCADHLLVPGRDALSNKRSTIGHRGTRRYAKGNERRRFNREAEAHALVPRTLSDVELGGDAITHGESVPVKVWVDYGNATVQVLAHATAWTRRAVLVFWMDSHNQRQEAWVWAGAVERIEP